MTDEFRLRRGGGGAGGGVLSDQTGWPRVHPPEAMLQPSERLLSSGQREPESGRGARAKPVKAAPAVWMPVGCVCVLRRLPWKEPALGLPAKNRERPQGALA